MAELSRNVYTVMAGCGVGEFLWLKQAADKCLVGGNVFCMMDSADHQELISKGLFNKLWDWAGEYMAGQPATWEMSWEIEWGSFNARGMELAVMLKEELGASADVQYVRTDEDPDKGSPMLVLANGLASYQSEAPTQPSQGRR
jgi:hypothetical protein